MNAETQGRAAPERRYPETRIGPFDFSEVTSTEVLACASGSSHRASIASCHEVATDLGFYTQPDPIGLEAGTNLFAYALGNPVINVDPAGLSTLPCCNQDFLTCLNACVRAGDPLPGLRKLMVSPGTPIPKWLLRGLGMRAPTVMGAHGQASAASVGSRLCGMGARNPVRWLGRFVFFPAFVTYGTYMAGLEGFCAAECANDRCFVMEGCQ